MSKSYNNNFLLPVILTCLVLVTTFVLLGCSHAQAGGAGLGTYSEGYRIGQISKFSVKGMMFKSGEGQMLMGANSTPYIRTYSCGDSTCSKTINPWYFSAEASQGDKILQYAGTYAVVKYTQAQVKSPAYDTDYMVVDIQPVDRSPMDTTCVDKTVSGSKSKGVRVGRIVKLSSKGHVNKTYEMMMQVGNAGGQFKNMTVKGDKMYQCMLGILKTGKQVKLTYTEAFFHIPGTADSNYGVTKVEPVQGL